MQEAGAGGGREGEAWHVWLGGARSRGGEWKGGTGTQAAAQAAGHAALGLSVCAFKARTPVLSPPRAQAS